MSEHQQPTPREVATCLSPGQTWRAGVYCRRIVSVSDERVRYVAGRVGEHKWTPACAFLRWIETSRAEIEAREAGDA